MSEIKSDSQRLRGAFKDLFHSIRIFFSRLIDLRRGLDKEGTINNIKHNNRMRGANVWLLMCSIMIASIGLDLNSPAIIIGAMLISPLMSPILGVGLAVAIYDKNTLSISLQHFGIAIGIAIFTSTVYFMITPFGDFSREISARTSPTLLDAMVAFFGGVAGIISGSRLDKTNAIPGVAIATALMPPLCVTGFGLAHLIKNGLVTKSFSNLTNLNNWEIMFNSFYLFFLNATLVAFATFLIVRLLKFPKKSYSAPEDTRMANTILFVFSLIIVIPSIFILRDVLQEINENRKIKTALAETFGEDQKYIDTWEKTERDSLKHLTVKVYGTFITTKLPIFKESLRQKLDYIIDLIPSTDIDPQKFNNILTTVSEYQHFRDSIRNDLLLQPLQEKAREIIRLERQVRYLTSDSLFKRQLEEEAIALFPEYLLDFDLFNSDSTATDPPLLVFHWRQRPNSNVEQRLVNLVKFKTKSDEVNISYKK